MERIAREFYLRRKESEGHGLGEYHVYDPLTNVVQALATGFLDGTYYASPFEVLEIGAAAHVEAAREDPEFHMAALKTFRDAAMVKDQVLIGLMTRNALPDTVRRASEGEELELLGTFPPHLLLRYADALRKLGPAVFGRGLGSRPKRLLRAVLESYDEDTLEYYAIKYRKLLYQLVRLVHPSLPAHVVAFLRGRDHPDMTARMRAALEVLRSPPSRRSVELALEHSLPYEVIRAKVPISLLSELPTDLLRDVVDRLMPATQFFLNVHSLLKFMDAGDVAELVRVKARLAPLGYIARAAREVPLRALIEAFDSRAAEVERELLPILPRPRFIALVDASGSMAGRMIENALTNYVIMRRFAVDTMYFSSAECGGLKIFRMDGPKSVADLNSAIEELELAGLFRGTPLAEALERAVEVADSMDVETIVLFTDEQENGAVLAGEIVERRPDKAFIVVNPSPYPAHAIPLRPNVYYVPASTPETAVATLRMTQMIRGKQESKKVVLAMAEERRRMRGGGTTSSVSV